MPTDTFTVDGTWTCPAGVTSAFVQCWAAGGGGGVNANAEGGGGGGGYSEATLTVVPTTGYAVVVGVGGTPGVAGENSEFGTGPLVDAGGGAPASGITGGAGGGAGLGDVSTSGGAGGNGSSGSGFRAGGGGGAAGSGLGNGLAGTSAVVDVAGVGGTGAGGAGSGGNGGTNGLAGVNGSIPGGGGGGSGKSGDPAGTGGDGLVTITYTSASNSATEFREYNMNRYRIARNSTSNTIGIWVQNSSTSGGLTGLVFNTASLVGRSFKLGTDTADVAITLAAGTLGTYGSGHLKEVDATEMPGYYQFGVPDSLLTGTHRFVTIMLSGAADMIPCVVTIEVMDGFNPRDYRRGLPHGFTS